MINERKFEESLNDLLAGNYPAEEEMKFIVTSNDDDPGTTMAMAVGSSSSSAVPNMMTTGLYQEPATVSHHIKREQTRQYVLSEYSDYFKRP